MTWTTSLRSRIAKWWTRTSATPASPAPKTSALPSAGQLQDLFDIFAWAVEINRLIPSKWLQQQALEEGGPMTATEHPANQAATAHSREIANVEDEVMAPIRQTSFVSAQIGGTLTTEKWSMFGSIAKTVANTPFVPRDLRGNPAAVMACLLFGDAHGLHPSISLTEVHVIDGRPGLSASLMVGKIRAAGHKVTREELRDAQGNFLGTRVTGERGDTGETDSYTFTLEMAARAGLLTKDNHKKYPEAMTYHRAASQLATFLFSDVFMGSPYTPEELGEEHTDEDGRPLNETVEEARDPVVNGEVIEDAETVEASGAGADVAEAAGTNPPSPAAEPAPEELPEPWDGYAAMGVEGKLLKIKDLDAEGTLDRAKLSQILTYERQTKRPSANVQKILEGLIQEEDARAARAALEGSAGDGNPTASGSAEAASVDEEGPGTAAAPAPPEKDAPGERAASQVEEEGPRSPTPPDGEPDEQEPGMEARTPEPASTEAQAGPVEASAGPAAGEPAAFEVVDGEAEEVTPEKYLAAACGWLQENQPEKQSWRLSALVSSAYKTWPTYFNEPPATIDDFPEQFMVEKIVNALPGPAKQALETLSAAELERLAQVAQGQ